MSDQLIEAPNSTVDKEITQLAYLSSYDVIANQDYAYVAYKEENKETKKWIIRISSNCTAGALIDPSHPSFRSNLSTAAVSGKNYIKMGFNMEPSDSDSRQVENRIYFDKSLKPTYVEIHLVTRNADNSPADKQVAKFDWP